MLVINCNADVLEKSELYDEMFLKYRDTIVALFTTQWKQEDIQGDSCVQLSSTQYFLAFLYVLLLYSERKEMLTLDSVLLEKYSVAEMKACFGCLGISIDKLLEIAGISLVAEKPCDGINTLQVQGNYGIGQKNCEVALSLPSVAKFDLLQILDSNRTKSILIPSNCINNGC